MNTLMNYIALLSRRPHAAAALMGANGYSGITGTVRFYQTRGGVLVAAEVYGLPISTAVCSSPIFAFHIHEGESCTGNEADPFADALMHYDPDGCPHPYHAGDLPPLFSSDGTAFSVFLTGRFTVSEIIGRTVIIHSEPDDFMTQPSGAAGDKIACGEIMMV